MITVIYGVVYIIFSDSVSLIRLYDINSIGFQSVDISAAICEDYFQFIFPLYGSNEVNFRD